MASNSWHHHIRPLSGTLLLAVPLLLIAFFFAARSSPFSALSLSRNPSSLPTSRRGSVIWSANRLFEWRPCGWWTAKAITALPDRSNGYVRIDCYGGLNQMRRDLCDGVGIARLLNATLVLPKFEVAAYWNESSGFEDIFDVDYFIQQTKGFVEVVKEFPDDLASKEPFKVDCSKRKGNFDYVEAVLPALKKHHYISITPAMSQRRDSAAIESRSISAWRRPPEAMAALHSSALIASVSPRWPARVSQVFQRGLYGGSVSSAVEVQISSSIGRSRNLSNCSASTPWSPLPARYGSRPVCCEAAGEGSSESFDGTVYKGIYGPWTIEPSDVREVILYRSGLVTAASSFVLAAASAFLPENATFREFLKQNIDFIYVAGAGGLGLSLLLIHIYVTPIKRFLQALWVIGVFGSAATYLYLANPLDEGLVQYVIENPSAIWFVGPLFAALTGLVFKEGLCYGKLEAGVLTFIIPVLLLGHLTGLMDNGTKLNLLGLWMALFVVFAARKFQQPIKDDIGDKSVFIFNALPEADKDALIKKLQQKDDGLLD